MRRVTLLPPAFLALALLTAFPSDIHALGSKEKSPEEKAAENEKQATAKYNDGVKKMAKAEEYLVKGDRPKAQREMEQASKRFAEAVEAIDRVFGARKRDVNPKEVKQLRARLEALLGSRERWTTALLRPLFDTLWKGARARRRSADHERVWLSLAGWCLRPGFGDAHDGWRIEQLWPIFEQGVQHLCHGTPRRPENSGDR